MMAVFFMAGNLKAYSLTLYFIMLEKQRENWQNSADNNCMIINNKRKVRWLSAS